MKLDSSDKGQNYIFWYSRYNENDEVKVVLKLLRAGDCFVDIGAHIGYFSLAAAMRVGRSGRVISFEPNPHTFKLLKGNVELNKCTQIELRKEAASDHPGKAAFHFKKDMSDFGASLMKFDHHDMSVDVKLTTLDSVIDVEPTVIKIDAEGGDQDVILGARDILSSKCNPPVLLTETLESNTEAYKLLVSLNYERFVLRKHRWIRYSPENMFNSNNSLWIRKDSFPRYIPRIRQLVKL